MSVSTPDDDVNDNGLTLLSTGGAGVVDVATLGVASDDDVFLGFSSGVLSRETYGGSLIDARTVASMSVTNILLWRDIRKKEFFCKSIGTIKE